MLRREEMFPVLLEVDPSFCQTWEDFLAEWKDEADLPYYLPLGELAYHLIDRLRRGETEGLQQVFDVVERWHIEGDHYVREAATIGLLEGMQNILGGQKRNRSFKGVRASDVEAYLGPESLRWWAKLYKFWDGDLAALREQS